MKLEVFITLVAAASAAPEPQAGGAGCSKVVLLFARGTTETGTMGVTVGPALSNALRAKFPGSFRAEGVPYPASFDGAISGAINPAGAKGAIKMAQMAKTILAKCPETKIILSGYSQGAEQVHGALAKQNLGDDGAKIAAAITYGDPMAGPATKVIGGSWGCLPEERAKVFCNKGDGVCGGAFSISAAHLSYTANGDIGKGAAFAVQAVNGKLGAPPGGCKFAPTPAELQAILCAAQDAAAAAPPKGGKGKTLFSHLLRRQAKGKGGAPPPKLNCPPKPAGPAATPASSAPPVPPAAPVSSAAPAAPVEPVSSDKPESSD